MRVFLDANVLFSASNAGSNIAQLVELLLAEANAVTSAFACEEARRSLSARRVDWLPAFEQLMQEIEVVPSTLFELPVSLDEKDRPLLCAAIRAQCTHFATGDRRDFGRLFGETVEQVEVVSLLGLARLLTASGD